MSESDASANADTADTVQPASTVATVPLTPIPLAEPSSTGTGEGGRSSTTGASSARPRPRPSEGADENGGAPDEEGPQTVKRRQTRSLTAADAAPAPVGRAGRGTPTAPDEEGGAPPNAAASATRAGRGRGRGQRRSADPSINGGAATASTDDEARQAHARAARRASTLAAAARLAARQAAAPTSAAVSMRGESDDDYDEWARPPTGRGGGGGPRPGGQPPPNMRSGAPLPHGRPHILDGTAVDANVNIDPPPTAMTTAELLRFVNAGGVASLSAPRSDGVADTFDQAKLLAIPEIAVQTLFGIARSAVLRIDDTAAQREANKDFKSRNAQTKQMVANGQSVPGGFFKPLLFYAFQHDRDGILNRSPILIRDLEEWAYLCGKWAIKDPQDACNTGDFREVLTSAEHIATRLHTLAASLTNHPYASVPGMLRTDLYHVLVRHSTVRLQYVRSLCDQACSTPGLHPYHQDYRLILSAYTRNHDTLDKFLSLVEKQIGTQSVSRGPLEVQEGYCSRVFLAWATAFLAGLRGGAAPPPVSALDDPAPYTRDPAVIPGYATGTYLLPAASNFSTHQTIVTPIPGVHQWTPPPPPLYSTIQQPTPGPQAHDHPPTGMFSLETMVRQTAAGYRDAGTLFALRSGSVDGTDLTLAARRVLWAHQLASGLRGHGPLISVPPDGELPPLSSYPMPYAPPPVVAPAPPPPQHNVATWQTQRPEPGPRPPPRNTDELTIPFSVTMLGQFTPYRSAKPQGRCFECQTDDGHFALECPVRFVRIKGEAPPGWRSDGPGRASKNPAEWSANLSELTDAARANYRPYIQRFALVPANIYPISVDDITGVQPPAPKRPSYPNPPRGGGARP